MPLDTSIPLGVQLPQYGDAVDPATQRYNALRMQALQQEMARNQLIMQNTMEDRRREEANRRVAAANAAAEQRRKQELMGVYGQFGTTPAAIGQRGAAYSGTGMSTDPYAPIQNELLKRGFVSQAEELAKVQKEQLAGEESKAKIPGLTAVSRKQGTEADTAEYDAAVSRLVPLVRMVKTGQDAASFTNTMYDDPVLGPKLDKIIPRAQAVSRAAAEYEANPLAWMQSHMLTGKELADAMATAAKPTEYEVKETAQGLIQVPKGGGEAKPVMMGGAPVMPKPSAQQEKAAIQTKQMQASIDTAITTLEDLIKPDSLIDDSTASGGGALIDTAAGFFGYATPGSVAASKLKVLADPILKMVPRFEGPQSDKDTQSYKEAAGELGNEYLPAARRKAAAETILKLFKKRRDQFTSADLPEAVPGASTTANPFQGFKVEKIGD